jgi:hypothetical protein
MKPGNTSRITAIAVLCMSLGMYAMAQRGMGHGNQMAQPSQNPSSMHTTTTAPTPKVTGTAQAKLHVKTSPTPRGHHYGWQKGKHNPHQSATTTPTP